MSTEDLYRAILSSLAGGVVVLDRSGRVTAASEGAAELLGVTTDQLLGRTPADARCGVIQPDGKPFLAEHHPALAALRTGASQRDVLMGVHRRDGALVWLSVNAAPVQGAAGETLGAVTTFIDVTAMKRSQHEAEQHARELQTLLDAVPAAVVITRTPDARQLQANRFFAERMMASPGGGTPASSPRVPGRRPSFPGERRYRMLKDGAEIPGDQLPVFVAARDGVEIRDFECTIQLDDGDREVRHVLGNAAPLRGPDGKVTGAVGAFLEITERKRAEQALRESEQKYSAIHDSAPFAISLTNLADRKLVSVNDAWVRMFGYTREEAIGHDAEELGLVSDPAGRARLYEEVRARRSCPSWETAYVTRAGEQRMFSGTVSVVEVRGRSLMLMAAQDITDRKRAEQKRKEMESELREADRRKDEFLGMLSHELRNPLAPIRNAIYILRHAEPGGAQARHAQEVIERQTEHLARLVDDLLDVTRIAHGKIELRRGPVDLRDVVLRAAGDFGALMAERGIALRTAVPAAAVWADADATRIEQVIGNLLHNAAKFTRSGDEVTLSLRDAGDGAEISVRDTGPGIEPALLPKVFDPFVQGQRTLARSEGGLGLGLALVKAITELHGGAVRADSAGPGLGAELVVRLPLGARPGAEHQGSATAPVPRRTGRRRVLVVDDNRDAAESMAEIVELLGHDAAVAYDGRAAVEKARASPPDVVLCDIGLPGMNGYEVARALRATATSPLQLVAVSGYAQPDDVKTAQEAGFDRHLAKPVSIADIEQLLS